MSSNSLILTWMILLFTFLKELQNLNFEAPTNLKATKYIQKPLSKIKKPESKFYVAQTFFDYFSALYHSLKTQIF